MNNAWQWISAAGLVTFFARLLTDGLKTLVSKLFVPGTPLYDWAVRTLAILTGLIGLEVAYLTTTTSPTFQGIVAVFIGGLGAGGAAIFSHHVSVAAAKTTTNDALNAGVDENNNPLTPVNLTSHNTLSSTSAASFLNAPNRNAVTFPNSQASAPSMPSSTPTTTPALSGEELNNLFRNSWATNSPPAEEPVVSNVPDNTPNIPVPVFPVVSPPVEAPVTPEPTKEVVTPTSPDPNAGT